jgi:hypothetical protein
MSARIVLDTPPLSVGRFELLGRADTGVPGAYRARGPAGERVGVYLFPAEAARQKKLADRLAAAADPESACDHPNVLRVLAAGREARYGYLVTEWVEGSTLARMIARHGRLPEAHVVRLAAQVGQAMDHARRGDVAPCRVGPENVLVRTDGAAKVIPFGLAPEPGAAGTAESVVRPEVAAELAADRAGLTPVPFPELIFSLGTLVYQALTGLEWVPPGPAAAPGKRRRRPPRPVGLTDRTERAIRRATDPDPARRPATCAALVKALRGRPLNAGAPKADARPVGRAADNRRGCVRYALGVGSNCTISTSVFDAADTPGDPSVVWPLLLQDVSATGVGLLLARRCEPGTVLSVEVVAGAEREVRRLAARVVRVRKDGFGHWAHGCAFVTPLAAAELDVLIDYLGRTDGA